jgi:hypothetical protein
MRATLEQRDDRAADSELRRDCGEHPRPKERLFATSRGLIQFCTDHPQQFRNVFFGPENRDGIRAGQYSNDIGAPLFQRFVQLFFDVAKDEGLPSRDDTVVAHTWWYTIFGLTLLMVVQGVVSIALSMSGATWRDGLCWYKGPEARLECVQ